MNDQPKKEPNRFLEFVKKLPKFPEGSGLIATRKTKYHQCNCEACSSNVNDQD